MELNNKVNHVVTLLKWTYGLVPIIAGLDKFANLLTEWHKYLAPAIKQILPFSEYSFMYGVGIIEIIAGILVLLKPKIGSLVVSLWLLGIILNLLISGEYFDIAVRDLVMSIGAFSLFLLLKGGNETDA
ncbi:tRNA (5-methylaminomethyl-2-thiouridylate)-methyltransferase [Christiangramia fulva]|uniref:tRNA (5-methylaminomethyl-2-thiouridylate)-methyltransferase n=1 Tax=Christiangramia fulva TaxID=2126553 RepID=A0A2R3Z1Y2_9FLAO|nr:tRNA (5-methylaminomethyl-2-thiouridylate)-methyltransferase [Christiangramia fulva]AVR44252.1 tRNA (5-methylaminomethyl-2-thiouridylate)-methyltransferase [Christiangramia fulva]